MITAPISLNGPVSVTKPPADQANRDTTATRHLCAGAYLDRDFRARVLRWVHGDPHHRVAPSYGFDLVPVVVHALRSWLLENTQHAVIWLVLVTGYLVDGSVVVTTLCWLGVLFSARAAAVAVPDVIRLKNLLLADQMLNRSWKEASRFKQEERLRYQFWVARIGTVGSVALLVASVISAGWAGTPAGEGIRWAFLLLALIAVTAATKAALRQRSLNIMQRAQVLRPDRLTRRQKVIDEQQSHTFVVFRRPQPKKEEDEKWWEDYDPFEPEPSIFVGSGQLVHRWLPPMVIQLLRPGEEDLHQREYADPPFRTHELVDHLRGAMNRICAPDDPGRLWLKVRDRVFIDERDAIEQRDFLKRRPGAARLREIIDNPHHAAHHYLEMQVTTSGELVTTVFLRATVRGRSLSLDFAACALTRTPFDYHRLDMFGESGTGAVVRAVLRALWRLPEETAGALRLAAAPLILGRAARAHNDRTLTPRRGILIGSRISIREDTAQPWKDSRFDETRIQDEIKVIEQRLLKATEDFLNGCAVDTSAFRRKATNIINNSGVLNMGGRLEIKQSAVGPRSQVHVQMQTPAAAPAQGGGPA